MSDEQEKIFATIEAALTFAATSLIVRTPGAIAEIHGPLQLRRGGDWLTIGEEAGSHVHLKVDQVGAVRFRASDNTNSALEVVGAGGQLVCRIVFKGTNPQRADGGGRARAESVRATFGHLEGGQEASEVG